MLANAVTGVIAKRLTVETRGPDLPGWAAVLILANIALFLPLILLMFYTWDQLLPTLAMLEDENATTDYLPVAPEDSDSKSVGEKEASPMGESSKMIPVVSGPSRVTSHSIRALHAVVRRQGGFKGLFRGLPGYAVIQLATAALYISMGQLMYTGFTVYTTFGLLISAMACIRWRTAWVHQVATVSSNRSIFSRFPPFALNMRAAIPPALLHAFVLVLCERLPIMLARCMGLPVDFEGFTAKPEVADIKTCVKLLAVSLFGLVLVFFTLPTRVLLTRIYASILPANEETIVPFDRSFGGRVVSLENGGRGYATIADAWKSLSAGALFRILKVYVQLIALTVVASMGLMSIVGIQLGLAATLINATGA